MATYFLRAKHISRSKGARATRAAAYRAGERIRDERTSEVYDYSTRRDIAHKSVILPSGLADRPDMTWAQDRAILWNAMEHAGLRRNSRVAREWLVFLPPELTSDQRVKLAQSFATELADKYRSAVDVTIHQPRAGADPRNHHAHLLMTTREVSPAGIGARTTLELGGRERHTRGLGPTKDEYLTIRERWAILTNDALHQAGLSVRVDHRSLKQQGINREPTPTIPEKVFYAERTQGHTAAGDAIRARHRERLQAREQGPSELGRVLEKQARELKSSAKEEFARRDAQPKRPHWTSLTRSERNELRRERYKAKREKERKDPNYEERRRAISRQRYHKSYARDPESHRQRRRQWRKEHTDEINRKQREYRKTNVAERNRKRREQRKAKVAQPQIKERTPEPAPLIESLKPKFTTPTAEESARQWKAYRESQSKTPTAEEAAAKWRALRESQKAPQPAAAPGPRAPTQHDKGPADTDEPTPRPTKDQDLGL
jgi:MobA/MobL family